MIVVPLDEEGDTDCDCEEGQVFGSCVKEEGAVWSVVVSVMNDGSLRISSCCDVLSAKKLSVLPLDKDNVGREVM
jgi:hypothetical protein